MYFFRIMFLIFLLYVLSFKKKYFRNYKDWKLKDCLTDYLPKDSLSVKSVGINNNVINLKKKKKIVH